MSAQRPNVVWVTLDSVRQDRTTMGSHHRDTTPRLAEIGSRSDGIAFSECISPSIWTLPSSASILTGTYPSHNTVGIDGNVLPDSIPTVAERFQDAGYETACLSRNGHLSDRTGLDRGFDRFQWIAASTILSATGPVTLTKYLFNLRRHSAGFTPDTAKHATPFLMNEVAKRWLRELESDDGPFFFYAHYNEPHRPYVPPIPWQDRYTDEIDVSPAKAVDISMDVHRSLYERVATGNPVTEGEKEALLAMYEAEIAYTDNCIGRLFEFVQSLNLENTIFIVTADHGELFGERGLLAHKLILDDALVNVPMVIHGLDAFDTGESGPNGLNIESDNVFSHVDLMQTLVATADGDTSGMQGVDLREEEPEYAICQRGPEDFEAFTDHNPHFDVTQFHGPLLTAIRTQTHKYLYSEDGSGLFELPDEETDVSTEKSDRATELHEKLLDWLETDGVPVEPGRQVEFDETMRNQLSDLGYLE